MIPTLHRRCLQLFVLVSALIFFSWCEDGFADGFFSFGDVEKPTPDFSGEGDRIVAKLVPRAKSTSVLIEFQVIDGGKLEAVKGVDFASVDRPEVDVKNFKSAVFAIEIGQVANGGSAALAIRSDFFTLSTAFYVFNPKRASAWIEDAQTENRALPQRARELVVAVKDGGDFDADGRADGHILLIGGPRDSFWGYALGTLFIRFFGIFIVLSLLMVGMIASGRIFKALDRFGRLKSAGPKDGVRTETAPPRVAQPSYEAPGRQAAVPAEVAAVIAATLYLREHASPVERTEATAAEPSMDWALEGRRRIMSERLMAANRVRGNQQ